MLNSLYFKILAHLSLAFGLIACEGGNIPDARRSVGKNLGSLTGKNKKDGEDDKSKDEKDKKSSKDDIDEEDDSQSGTTKEDEGRVEMVSLKGTNGANPYECKTTEKPSQTNAKRLSRYEYLVITKQLFGDYLQESDLNSLKSELQADTSVGLFKELDSSISFQHVESFFAIARKIAGKLVQSDNFLKKAFPCELVDSKCLDTFGKNYGSKIFRRTWSDNDSKAYLSLSNGKQDSLAVDAEAILSAALQSPEFIYKIYYGEKEESKDIYFLGANELAHRLSLTLTGGIPDDLLQKDADSKKILDPKIYLSHVDRLFKTKEAQLRLDRFFSTWLGLEKLSIQAYEDYFLEGAKIDGLDVAARKEMLDLIKKIVIENDGNYTELLTTREKIGKNQVLDQIYKIYPGEGEADSANTYADSRKGILTKVGFLMSGDNKTHLVHRGLKVRVNILCDQIKSPNIDEDNIDLFAPIEPDAGASAREQIEKRTSPKPCMVCHTGINPPGFVMEAFDGLGRERIIEKVFNKKGEVIKEHKVSVTTPPNIESTEEPAVKSLAEMAERISKSSKGPACVVNSWLRFSRQKTPRKSDSCELQALYSQLKDPSASPLGGDTSGTIKNFLKASVLTSQFKLIAK